MSTFIAMLLSVLLLSGTVVAAPVKVLRVCADPDNMPFSSANPSERGLYVELADLIAARLGVPTEYFWWASYFGKRTVRSTLLSDRCAAYFGLPSDPAFMGKRLLLTRPFLHVGYAIMAPAALRIAQLDDLKGKTVGVEFRTGPHILLASQDDFQVSTFRRAEEVLEALRRGEVETAFVWGPMAGYYNTTRLGSAYQIIPVAGPGLQWQVAIGVKPGNEVLKEALERELEHLQPQILRLAEQYGFPLTTPVRLEARLDGTPPVDAADQPSPAPLKTNPFQGDASLIPGGRSLFNQHCAHCHSPNAMNPEPSTDLRRLQGRYRENMAQVFYTTVSQGRSTKGMPAWEGILNADMIWTILTFLESVQHKP